MAVTFQRLIAKNKRNSVILILFFLALFWALGWMIGYVWGGGDSDVGVFVAVVAGLIGLGLTALAYYLGDGAVLSMSKAKEISKADDPQLFNVVEEMSIAAGVPMPRVYLINDSAPNAFATGRDPRHGSLAITTGLRTKLTRDELQGVMAHELSHVRNYDMLFAMLMATMIGVLVMLCDLFIRTLRFGRVWGAVGKARGRQKGNAAVLVLIVAVIAIILAVIAPLLSRIINMALSRQREYLADAGAVELTRNPLGLAGALQKISDDPDVLEVANRATAGLYIVHPIKKFEDRASTIFDTHPPVKDRIARLMQMAN